MPPLTWWFNMIGWTIVLIGSPIISSVRGGFGGFLFGLGFSAIFVWPIAHEWPHWREMTTARWKSRAAA